MFAALVEAATSPHSILDQVRVPAGRRRYLVRRTGALPVPSVQLDDTGRVARLWDGGLRRLMRVRAVMVAPEHDERRYAYIEAE
jgi:hypothetical protein